MTERIDHAAEAIAQITEWDDVDFHVGIAQVHATLALAEQQRIANLIAWATANGSEPSPATAAIITEGLKV